MTLPRFRRVGLRIGTSAVVHAVTVVEDRGAPVAIPACDSPTYRSERS